MLPWVMIKWIVSTSEGADLNWTEHMVHSEYVKVHIFYCKRYRGSVYSQYSLYTSISVDLLHVCECVCEYCSGHILNIWRCTPSSCMYVGTTNVTMGLATSKCAHILCIKSVLLRSPWMITQWILCSVQLNPFCGKVSELSNLMFIPAEMTSACI